MALESFLNTFFEKILVPVVAGGLTAYLTTTVGVRYRARRQIRGLAQILFYVLDRERAGNRAGSSVPEGRDALIERLLDRVYDNDVIAHENTRTAYALYTVAYTLTALRAHPDDPAILKNAWADVGTALERMGKGRFVAKTATDLAMLSATMDDPRSPLRTD
jgi:hypothetical protein